jgi:transcription-repair coupling factor (superfamily II helicase)
MKQLRAAVDVLSMTATPIPRTLYMSLSGVRDMSVIETAPLDRLPVETVIRRFSRGVIKEALERELERGGQVFFVHNRIQSLPSMAKLVQELVPQARVIMGHGQMKERELEATMVKFVTGQADILVSTAIVESGLDIPASNTIIVNRADRFGLAQLYQLRGRVGRERQQAYAYLLVPADGRVDERPSDASGPPGADGARLGVQARPARPRDPGAGNILGPSSTGTSRRWATIFIRSFSPRPCENWPAVRPPLTVDPVISVNVEGFLPDDYVPEVNQRLALYKRLAGAAGETEVDDLRAELADRFGPLPAPAEQLLDIVRIRVSARPVGIEKIEAGDGKALVTFSPATPIEPERLVRTIAKSRGRLKMKRDFVLEAQIARGEWPRVRDSLLGLLGELSRT